ncbi:MAG: hypothetical protein R2789_15980 [Microthrixaceae bacterium]
MTVVVALLALTVGLLAALVISLLRSHADVLRALEELGVSLDPDADGTDPTDRAPAGRRRMTGGDPVADAGTVAGVPAPADLLGHAAADISGITPEGDATTIGTNSGDVLVAFLSSGCTTCHRFWDAFASGEQLDEGLLADGTRVVVVTHGVESESPARIAELAPTRCPWSCPPTPGRTSGCPWPPTSPWWSGAAWSVRELLHSGPRLLRCSNAPVRTQPFTPSTPPPSRPGRVHGGRC